MLQQLLRFARRRRSPNDGREGFVYVSGGDEGPMQHASQGAVVRVAGRGPPWIVVGHERASLIVAKWPGRRWHVRVAEAATLKDQRKAGGAPHSYARYTRAVAVEIIQEEEAWILFGPEGRAVSDVIDAGSKLEQRRAELLASNRHPEAASAYDRSWRAWMREGGIPDGNYEDLDGTLLLGISGSPINKGLAVLHGGVFKRAEALDGDAATAGDGEDVWLASPWNGASCALCDAALAMGAPKIVSPNDRNILMQAWMTADR
jgi:hypothetical protein